MRRRAVLLAFALAFATPAAAAETGCAAFAWDLSAERRLLESATVPTVASGGRIEAELPAAIKLTLVRPREAGLVPRPGREGQGQNEGWAGWVSLALPREGTWRVTLSADGWVNVTQDGQPVQTAAFTGVRDCPGLRKSVAFRLRPGPKILQVTEAREPALSVAVTPDP